MKVKGIIDEDFINYYKPSMTIMFPNCSFKCGKELCQNSELARGEDYEISHDDLCKRYLSNDISQAIVCQGLEPFDSWYDLLTLIVKLRTRYGCKDDIVIYSGYTKEELEKDGFLRVLRKYENIIVKFGRYIPNQEKHLDDVLKIYLASDNQFAERLN